MERLAVFLRHQRARRLEGLAQLLLLDEAVSVAVVVVEDLIVFAPTAKLRNRVLSNRDCENTCAVAPAGRAPCFRAPANSWEALIRFWSREIG